MSLNTIKKLQSERGFTLVELLIVIVIIAILAAITIVAYNGITNRAHASAAQQAAQNVVNKAEAFNAENGYYPNATTNLTNISTSAPSTPPTTTNSSWYLPSTAVNFAASDLTAAPANDNTVFWKACGTAGSGTGVTISWWDYSKSSSQKQTMSAGTGC